jgi:hypothetical protein
MKSSKARHRWDGFIVCDADFEHRHPQDFIRTKPDNQTVPFSRPKETPQFVSVTYLEETYTCMPSTRVAEADRGVAGCATVGTRTMNDLVD